MNKKRIVCYGDSNTWGYDAETNDRFEDDIRWTQVLQQLLGNEYIIIEEGVSGRTTVFDDPLNEGLNGKWHLHTTLMSHCPIDGLVIMLGTNDCKERFSASPQNIADGIERLIQKAKSMPVWKSDIKILIVAPIIILDEVYASPVAGEMGKDCVRKSQQLPELMRICAKRHGCYFFNANEVVTANPIDFMHFDKESHTHFAKALAPIILKNM